MSTLDHEEARAHFRRRLEAMGEEARQRRRHLREWGLGQEAQEAAGDLSSYDQHTGDAGTGTYERSRDLGLWEETVLREEEIQEALERLDAGTFGICEGCGGSIGWERLEALPTARLCVDCAREAEAGRSAAPALRPSPRPGLQEGWRSPAFERRPHGSPLLEEEGRQEVWEALGDYPSSNSLQDEPERAVEAPEP